VETPEQFKDICDRFTEQYSAVYSPEATFPMGGINLECFHLTAFVEKPEAPLPEFELQGAEPPAEARLEPREAYWESEGGMTETPVFAMDPLQAGNMIEGPALVEAEDTTVVVEPGWRFTLDRFRNGLLERV
jgi:N-methylhydantoinase A/acetophenone carboxylase